MKSKLVPIRAAVAVALIGAFAAVFGPAAPSQAAGPPPTITSVSPTGGPTAGGTPVTITGTNFIGTTGVNFGASNAAFVVDSNTQISAVSPPHAAGKVDIVVGGLNGTTSNGAADQFTYVAPQPHVLSVNPTQGPQDGGTSVTIVGTGFTGADTTTTCLPKACGVFFGSVPAASFVVSNDSQITATSPQSPTAGPVHITVTTPGGTSGTSSSDQFTFIALPTVTSINPTGGSTTGGTSVTITGTGFNSVTAVHFGATAAASFTANSATQITATSPASPGNATGAVDVTVTAAGGTSPTNANDKFTYVNGPVVTQVNPTGGPTTGGTAVVISGSGFTGADTASCSPNPCGVFFGTPSATFTVKSDTEIDAMAPAQSSGTVNVHVRTPVGVNTDVAPNNDAYTYVGSGPQVTSVSPPAGPVAGGTMITVQGADFNNGSAATPATGVLFTMGGTSTCVTISSSQVNATNSQITLSTPAEAAGIFDLQVVAGGTALSPCTGAATSPKNANDEFQYVAAPTVSSLSPTHGPADGGGTITINGSNFSAPNVQTPTVEFGSGNFATNVVVVSGSQITATLPPGVDAVPVIVTTQYGGSSSSTPSAANTFTYGPLVFDVNPNRGPAAGGNSVTIDGVGFKPSPSSGTPTVHFGANVATVTAFDDASITVTAPAKGGQPSSVHITVTQSGETSPTSGNDVYEWLPLPTVTGVSPTFGSTQGGDSVTITGTNFDFTNEVDFGLGNAAHIVSVSTTQIMVTTPSAPAAGLFDVRVLTDGGTSAINRPGDQYQYVQVPTVASVAPSSGVRSGGTTVTVTGSGYSESSPTVKFGGTAATGVNVIDDSHLTAVSPAGSVGTVHVTVTTIGGTSPTSSLDQFAYTPEPVSASSASPIGIIGGYGPENVTIFGSGFQPGATVTSNNPGVFVTVNSVSANQISTTVNTRSASASAASVGVSSLIVHNPDGGSANLPFLVAASGYYTVTQAGTVGNFGSVPFAGDLTGVPLNKPIVGMAATPDGNGYWLVASDGGIFTFGDAGFFGSEGGVKLNKPIVGMATTPDGKGYWLVASDGGIFTHGDAAFFGSEGGVPLNQPVVGMAPTHDGRGYWLVASDGGIFTHGDAAFFGSEGGLPLNKPVVGMEPTHSGQGYWLVASDGGVFTHGDAPFVGSLGSVQLNSPIMGMAPSLLGTGYYLLGGDGGVFTFNVPFYGSSPTGGPAAAIADVARVR